MSDKPTTIDTRRPTPRREQLHIELRGEGHKLVGRWAPDPGELGMLKELGHVLRDGLTYRYAGTQDYCAVFVLEVPDER